METVLLVDTAFRGAAAGFALLLTGFASLRLPRGGLGAALALLGLGLAAYALVSAPSAARLAGPAEPALVLLAVANPALMWWAGLELFEANRAFRRAGPAAALGLVGLYLFDVGAADIARQALAATFYLHVLYIAASGAGGDLVASRRRLRGALVGLVAFAGLGPGLDAPALQLAQATLLALLLAAFLLWLLRAEDHLPLAAETAPGPHSSPALSPAELAVLDRLEAAMAKGAWAEEGLTIAALAGRLGTSEHRLRRLINQGLGYRNFARFVNERRIAAAQALLADPARADQPVLSIAFEVGFASLGPFNRAFREIAGRSPSDYRAAELTKPK